MSKWSMGIFFFQNHETIILTTNKIENEHFHLSTYIGHLLAYLTGDNGQGT